MFVSPKVHMLKQNPHVIVSPLRSDYVKSVFMNIDSLIKETPENNFIFTASIV